MLSRRSLFPPALFALSALCGACASSAQIPGLTSSTPAATSSTNTPAVSHDPLGRENPRGTVLGFIKAAQDEKYNVAVQYFQPSTKRKRNSPEEEQDLVPQLLAILNQRIAGPLDFISRDPLGRLDDGLPTDQEKVSGALGVSDPDPIFLVRMDDEAGHKLWYFSRETLERVPEMFESLQFPEFE